jgi:broad specificity phosphatase PhoE
MTPVANKTSNDGTTSYTIYLVRHGEALHNVKEKLAMESAKKAAIEEGLDPEQVKRRVEEARVSILEDETLFDSPLSQKGKEEAASARQAIHDLEASGLPVPTYVLVSPLQRAMQTANIIFPDCDDIHVRDELKERQTGLPCDTREHAESLRMRRSFQRFSMVRLMRSSLTKTVRKQLERWLEEESDDEPSDEFGLFLAGRVGEGGVEDKPMLRARTKKLLTLLRDSGHHVLAVVTHKGFLRELERGTFGQEDAAEFSNCEVRVYQVTFNSESYILEAAERVA